MIETFPISHIISPYENPDKDAVTGRLAVGVPLAAVPDGTSLVSLRPYFDAWRTRPERRIGHFELSDEKSLINFINRYKNTENTVIFIERLWFYDFRVTCIFNFHPAGPNDDKTGFGDFRASAVVNDAAEVIRLTGLPFFYGDAP